MDQEREEMKKCINEDILKLIHMEFNYAKLAVALKGEGRPFGAVLKTIQQLKHELMALEK